jgi:2-C-methyl-D-erythritol 4-phosphate cytidylyltransferase/2-C-methyl-D-erythritol 2,4-cyclodiphosphate synthase
MAPKKTSALLAAAGQGERLGLGCPKAFAPLGGRPLLTYSLDTLRRSPLLDEIVILLPPAEAEAGRRLLSQSPSRKTEKLVLGGAHRQDSVAAGLREVAPDCDLVLVHDAARPFLTEELIAAALEAAAREGACAVGLPASDTIKLSDPEGTVSRTLDRSLLWTIQTPQAFRLRLLLEAHQQAERDGFRTTDDASLVERLGHRVRLVPGSPGNIKITTPYDLWVAERMLAGSSLPAGGGLRFGFGYDVHRLVEGRPLLLGGVRFDFPRGLAGHSDADVLCHAIADALLGAAAAGDIGHLFPDSDPQYAGISSLVLLERVAGEVRARGYEIANIDSVVAAQAPRIAGRVEEIASVLGQALQVDPSRLSVKATTTDGLGFIGASEGIASYAVCSLRWEGRGRAVSKDSGGPSSRCQEGD